MNYYFDTLFEIKTISCQRTSNTFLVPYVSDEIKFVYIYWGYFCAHCLFESQYPPPEARDQSFVRSLRGD